MADRDAALNAVAARQHRVVSTRRLRSLGFSDGAIARRVKEGDLKRLYQGVYLVGPGAPTREGRWLAAVIAAGDGALLSDLAAGSHWDVLNRSPWKIDVTIPRHRRASLRGVRIHRRRLHADDCAVHDRIPITSVERTLCDLAARVSAGDLKRVYERAEQRRIVDHRKLAEAVERMRGRQGAKAMRDLLGYDPTPATETRSELETRFLEFVTESELPPYQRNVLVEGEEVDAYWPEAGVIVELQSHAYHSDKPAFDRDHAKNAKLQGAGYAVLPITDYQLKKQRAATREALWRLLDARSAALRLDSS